MSPQRIQRRRTKGWRMPEGAVYVGRPSRWGNPWQAGNTGWTIKPGGRIDREPHDPLTVEQAIESFRNSEENQVRIDSNHAAYLRAKLGGKDLACWCPLDQPCHADVLLELANAAGPRRGAVRFEDLERDIRGAHEPVVYYIASQYAGIVKVGTSKNVLNRIKRLEKVQPAAKLRILALEYGDDMHEARRHSQFSRAYHQGEWYWITPELEAHIVSLGGEL